MSSENVNAKALLEQAGGMLCEALDLAEEGTDKHDTIGSACDDLDFVMHQMWPNENSEPWQDGTDPVDHAVDCFLRCREVAICGEDGTPSVGIVCEAMADLNKAFILLWGNRYTAELASRRNEAAQRRATAMLEAEGIGTMEATESLTNAMYKRASEFPISTREDAIDALMDAAAGTAALVGTLLAITGTVDEQASAALIRASKEAGNANMQTLRAIGYLNKCNAKSSEEA